MKGMDPYRPNGESAVYSKTSRLYSLYGSDVMFSAAVTKAMHHASQHIMFVLKTADPGTA